MNPENIGQQFVMMRPSALLPFAGDRSDKMAQAKVNALADSIKQHGYRADKMRGNKAPITLEHHDHYPGATLTEGNHRVHALTKIGYDRPVKVRVSDFRR